MGFVFYGLLGGFLVNIMPGAKRKQGLETLNVEQHRPPIAYIISYGILFIAFIGLPIYFWVRNSYDPVGQYLISVVMVSPAGFIFVAHCHTITTASRKPGSAGVTGDAKSGTSTTTASTKLPMSKPVRTGG